ncbi:MAG: ATP-binding cassette domain-containing protein [Planctomycetota bacterium]|nr:MAG: ATP-binding cassette domain-containing protein [Planctomycetota bacterium]
MSSPRSTAGDASAPATGRAAAGATAAGAQLARSRARSELRPRLPSGGGGGDAPSGSRSRRSGREASAPPLATAGPAKAAARSPRSESSLVSTVAAARPRPSVRYGEDRASPDAGAAPRPAVRALALGRRVGERTLLHDLSFAVYPGERVAVLGPSGAGKSVLVELLAGAARPSSGHLELLGRPHAEAATALGYVPQAEAVHEVLTLREALLACARLRVPELAASPLLLEERVAAVVTRLRIAHRLETRIARLSGGERRRVGLAIELLTDPEVLLCDEVTSGLDARSAAEVDELLGELAREGRAVLCTTHVLTGVEGYDRVLVLAEGRLLFDGSPAAALAHFGVERFSDLYARLDEQPAATWEALRPPVPPPPAFAPRSAAAWGGTHRAAAGVQALGTLFVRGVRVTLRDGRSLALNLAQAVLIALLIAFAYEADSPAARAEVGFKLVLSVLWLGCVAACQEVVKERAVFARERLTGLSPHAYTASKVLLVLLFALVQTALFTGVVYAAEPLGASPLEVGGVLALAAVSGSALGLLVSTAATSRTAAVGATPLVLVPQVVFVGTVEPLTGVAAELGRLMPSHWGNEAMRRVLAGAPGFPWSDAGVLPLFAAVFLLGSWGLLLVRDEARGGPR